MKIFKIMAVALVAMLGFNSCSEDCDHEFIEHDFTQELVGTWTYDEGEQAEAIEINPDGSFTITGVMKYGALYEEKGSIKVVNNKVTLAYNSGDVFEGRLELVAGKSLSIVLFEEENIRLTYDYCKEDLSDEIIGMWVCTDAPTENGEAMIVHSFMDNGKATYTGFGTYVDEYLVKKETTYEVVGDLLFYALPKDKLAEGEDSYITKKLAYRPNGIAYGDIMEEKTIKSTSTMLRIKQSLDLNIDKKYDYSSVYISNAKGSDFTIMDYTFDASKADGSRLDAMLKHLLFCVEFPTPNTIKYKYRYNDNDVPFEAPITVDGNKVTIDMTVINSAYRKVDMYMFQDADNSQLHMYMPTSGFINYFANIQLTALNAEGKIDLGDTAAVEKVFADLDACVESINVSFVMKARK